MKEFDKVTTLKNLTSDSGREVVIGTAAFIVEVLGPNNFILEFAYKSLVGDFEYDTVFVNLKDIRTEIFNA